LSGLNQDWSEVTLGLASIACLMMAAVSTLAGVHHLVSFAMRRRESLHLPFAGLCLSVAGYDLFSTGVYEAQSVEDALFWQVNQVRAAHWIAIFTMWFVAIFTEQRRLRTARAIMAWFALLFALSYLPWPGFALSAARPAIKHVYIPGVLRTTYYEAELEALQAVALASFVVGYVYLLALIKRFYANTRNSGALWVGAGQVIYFVGATNDVLIGLQVYPFIYVSEYCFFCVILGMFVVLLRDFVHARSAVEQLNAALDARVGERTLELAQAHEEMRRALTELKQRDERLRENIEQARLFQERLLPVVPSGPKLAFDVVFRPLEVVAGDIYDICELAPTRYRLFLADATGHGVQAAMRTMLLKTEYDRLKRQSGDPTSVLQALNRRLVELFPEGEAMSTATCVDIQLDARGAACALASAAAPSPMVLCGDSAREVRAEGTFLGLAHDDWPPAIPFRLGRGDVLLMFSDGLVEQRDQHQEFFALARAVTTLRPADTRSYARQLVAQLDEFRGPVPLGDDLTVITALLPAT
jgi:serine phosphatase RsbU (regulator of sigma subunit)